MIVNPEKLQAILLYKRKYDLTNLQLNIDDTLIKLVQPVKLQGNTLDDKLSFKIKSAKCSNEITSEIKQVLSYQILIIALLSGGSVA